MAETSFTGDRAEAAGSVPTTDPNGLATDPNGLAWALDHAPDLVRVTDAQGVCLYASRSASTVLGYPPERLRGLSLLELTDHADQTLLSQARASLHGGQDEARVVHRARHAAGHLVWLETRVQAVRRNGVLVAIVSISRDITVQHAAEQRAADADRISRIVLDAIGEGVILLDEHGRVVQANAAAGRLVGRPTGMIGVTRTLFEVHDEDGSVLPETELPSRLAQREGRTVERIVATRRPNGSLAYLRATAVPLGPPGQRGDATVAVILTNVVDDSLRAANGVDDEVRAGETSLIGQSPLTQREIEVLTLLADTLSIKEIATRLTLSEHTVRGHVKSILAKLGASSQLKAVLVAMRAGLIPQPRDS